MSKRLLFIAYCLLLIVYSLLLPPPLVNAIACPNLPNIGDVTISGTGACSVSGVIGIDKPTANGTPLESSNTNFAQLSITNSTINLTGVGAKLIVGSFQLNAGGSINILEGTEIKIGTPLYIQDSDSDGWPDIALGSATFNTATVSGWRRMGLMRGPTVDCGSGSFSVGNTCTLCYQDFDGDTKGNASVSQTMEACSGQFVADSSDCNDQDANVFIPHTQCYTDGDGDTYTIGLAANTTCLNTASCATATKASLAVHGDTALTYTAGGLRDAVNGSDCNDASASVWQNLTGYADADGDAYTVVGSSQVCSGAALPAGYLASASSPVDANDAQACASGANPSGTCNKCVNGAIANQTSSEDQFTECGALDCNGGATKYYYGWVSNTCYYEADVSAANAQCNGSGSCDTAASACPSSGQGGTSGVTRGICDTQVGCSGTTIGSTGTVATGSDTYNDCANTNSVIVQGWYPSSSSTKSCSQVCASLAVYQTGQCQSGGCQTTSHTCVDMGLDASGTNNLFATYFAGASCSSWNSPGTTGSCSTSITVGSCVSCTTCPKQTNCRCN